MRLASIRRFVAGLGWAIAATTTALLPGLGPMLDHHYAGRQPGHSHIHVGVLLPDHLHGHEVSHDHDHDHHKASATGDEEDPGGYLAIASYSGAATVHAYVAGSASQIELSFPDPNGIPHAYCSRQDGALCQQSFVAPPTQPPKA